MISGIKESEARKNKYIQEFLNDMTKITSERAKEDPKDEHGLYKGYEDHVKESLEKAISLNKSGLKAIIEYYERAIK